MRIDIILSFAIVIITVSIIGFMCLKRRTYSGFTVDSSIHTCLPISTDPQYNNYNTTLSSIQNGLSSLNQELTTNDKYLTANTVNQARNLLNSVSTGVGQITGSKTCKTLCEGNNTAIWNPGVCTCVKGYGHQTINVTSNNVDCILNTENSDLLSRINALDQQGVSLSQTLALPAVKQYGT